MKIGSLGALAALFLSAGWAVAQPPTPTTSPPAGPAAKVAAGGGATPTATTAPPVVGTPGIAPIYSGAAAPPLEGGAGCGPNGCNGAPAAPGCGRCASGPAIYASLDYLLWNIRNPGLPAAVTALPFGVITVPANVGGGVTPVVPVSLPVQIRSQATSGGGPALDQGDHSGGRFAAGFWVDPEQTWGMETVVTFLERAGSTFSAATGNAANPFQIDTGVVATIFVPGGGNNPPTQVTTPVVLVRQTNSTLVAAASTGLLSGELNCRCVGLRIGCVDFGGLLGFRYLNFRDDLTVFNTVRLTNVPGVVDPVPLPGGPLTFASRDAIKVQNHFYGGQVGVDIDAKFGSFFIYTRAKVALGTMQQIAYIDSTSANAPGATTAGGILASANDVGSHTRNKTAFIPEVNLKVGYQLTDWLRGYVGYDALYITDVARPSTVASANTINTRVQVGNNVNQVNVATPAFRFRDQDVWARGFNFGVEVRY